MRANSIIAFDKSTVRTVDIQGFLHVSGCNISKATVNDYFGAEIPNWEQLNLDSAKRYSILRPADELEKAAATFNNLPLLDTHIEVGAIDLEDPNIKKHIVGSTGTEAEFVGPYLQNSLVIWTAGAIAGVETKEQTELSCAYRYDIDMTPGDFEGKRYDGSMKNIVGNHVALVGEGRAGHDVVVADSKLVEDIIVNLPDHKDNEGKSAPWVIKSEKDGSVLWSGASKEDAQKRLAHMHSFAKDGGPGSGPQGSSDRAEGATRYAKANNSTKNHMTASRLHLTAQKEHQMAGNTKEAEQHRIAAIGHANAARVAPVRDEDCSMTKDIAERKDMSPKSGLTKYGKTEFADPKNHKYPIDRKHIANAASRWGNLSNRSKYSKEDQAKITQRIESAERRFKIGKFAESGKANDSMEAPMGKQKARTLTPQGLITRGALFMYLRPRMAADAVLKLTDLNPVLKSITPGRYSKQLPGVIGAVKAAFGGKLAKDADLDIEELKDLLQSLHEAKEDGGEEEEEDADDAKIPMKDEDVDAADDDDDDDDVNAAGAKLMKMLSNYDIPEADLQTIHGLIVAISKPVGTDDDVDAADGDNDDDDDGKGGFPAKKKLEEALMPQPISKPAMDAALDAQKKATIAEVGARFQAGEDVFAICGRLDVLTMDSASIYKMALDQKGIDTKGVHPSAFKAMVKMIKTSSETGVPILAADAAGTKDFLTRYPSAAKTRKA